MKSLITNRLIHLIEALRSGKYKKTNMSMYLQDRAGFDACGVACDVYITLSGEGYWIAEDTRYLFMLENKRHGLYMPKKVYEFFGWTRDLPVIKDKYIHEMDLKDAADLIEANL